MTEEELSAAVIAFGETDNPQDRGIAAYLAGEYAVAETALKEVAEDQESDFIETLRFLGASQYEQGNYDDAVATFRKAVALGSEDAALLGWFGIALYRVANWAEAEEVQRETLTILLQENGKNHPLTATGLNNLAQLLQATNRLQEAEPLMRRALEIFENSLGEDHPNSRIVQNNLAALLAAINKQESQAPE